MFFELMQFSSRILKQRQIGGFDTCLCCGHHLAEKERKTQESSLSPTPYAPVRHLSQ